MFTEGFEKHAGVPQFLAGAAGKTISAIKGAPQAIKSYAQRSSATSGKAFQRGMGTYPSAVASGRLRRAQQAAGGQMSFGESAAAATNAQKGTKLDTAARYKRMNQKPSFASRHPLITGVGMGIAAKSTLGGGDKDEPPQQPRVMGSNY